MWKPFVIFGKTTVPAKPSESSLNNPSTWQNMKSGGYHGRFLARSDPDLMNTGPPMLYDFDRPAEVFPGPGFQPFIMAVAPHEPKVGKEPLNRRSMPPALS